MFFEGEIYNKKELGFEGTDAEVALAAYRKWGVASFAKLRGAFAFAIEDGTKTILVRDHFGVYPLYYYDGQSFLYGTSVRGLLDRGVPRKLSRAGLCTFMAYGSLQHPWTMIDGVMCVPPASYLVKDSANGSVQIKEYWIPKFEIRQWRSAELNEAITSALFESVKRQVQYGGNPSAFLSGGIDSSAITIMMRKLGVDQDVRTYCISTEKPGYDERKWARMVAERNHTHHTELTLSDEMIRTHLDEAISSYDQPTVDGVNFWFGSKLIKEAGEEVIFSGEGGDELFLGWSQMYKALMACSYDRYFRWLPRWVGRLTENLAPQEKFRKLGQLMGRNVPPFYIAWRIFSENRIAWMLKSDVIDFKGLRNPVDDSKGIPMDVYNYVSWMDLRNVDIDMYLRDGFQTSAPHGLNVRTPILDVDLTEILYSVPGREKYDPKIPKPHLIRACGDGLPVECTTRPKMGFSMPLKEYLHGMLKDKMEDFLRSGNSLLFKPSVVQELGRRFYSGRVYWSNVWMPFIVENWCRQNRIEL